MFYCLLKGYVEGLVVLEPAEVVLQTFAVVPRSYRQLASYFLG